MNAGTIGIVVVREGGASRVARAEVRDPVVPADRVHVERRALAPKVTIGRQIHSEWFNRRAKQTKNY